jgi:hypothetical protein
LNWTTWLAARLLPEHAPRGITDHRDLVNVVWPERNGESRAKQVLTLRLSAVKWAVGLFPTHLMSEVSAPLWYV